LFLAGAECRTYPFYKVLYLGRNQSVLVKKRIIEKFSCLKCEQRLYYFFIAFFIIFASKCIHIYYSGVDVVWADSWDGEIEKLYYNYLDGTLSIKDFISQANEHRIILTKISNLLIFILMGDSFVQHVVLYFNAAIFSIAAAFIVYTLNKNATKPFASFLIIVISSLVLDWENAYWSYQSQVYFSILFASISIYFFLKNNILIFSILVIIACGANASAVYLPIITFVFSLFFIGKRRFYLSIYLLVLLFIAYNLALAPTPWHDIYKAKNIWGFVTSFSRFSNFPINSGFGVIWLSIAFFLFLSLFNKKIKDWLLDAFERKYAILLLFWFFLFLLASSYNRAGFSSVPPRYYIYYYMGFWGIVILFSNWIETRNYIFKFIITTLVVAIFTPQIIKSYSDWSLYEDHKRFNKDIVCETRKHILKLESENVMKADIEKMVLDEVKKYPLQFSGYPNYKVPIRVMMNDNADKIFHCDYSVDLVTR